MADNTTPPPAVFWEDVEIGSIERSSTVTPTADEIVDFARKFDPHPIHVDLATAQAGPFGGLTASGSHMFSIRNLLCHDFEFSRNVIVGIGVDEVRYLAPLRPGQACQLEVEHLEKIPSKSKPDRGVVRIRMTLLADGKPVMNMIDNVMMRRRQAA